MASLQVICDTCRAPGVIPATHWWAHCPNVLCPSRDKLLLRPVIPGKKYIRINCEAVAYRCIDQESQSQLCDCCHVEHTVVDVIAEVRNSQPIYKTQKAPAKKREERQEIDQKEPMVEIDLRKEGVAEKKNKEANKKVSRTSSNSSGVWVTCDKCQAVKEMPTDNWWLSCACNSILFAPLRSGRRYIRIKCKIVSYRSVAERETVAMCDCCGPTPVEHTIGSTVVEMRNGQPVYGAVKSSGAFLKQFDKLRAAGKELFSTNNNKEKPVEEASGASAPPMEMVDMGAVAESEKRDSGEKMEKTPVYPEIPEMDRLKQEKAKFEEALHQKDVELQELQSRMEASEAESNSQLSLTEDALNTAVASLKMAMKELNTEKETVARMRAENREAEGLLGEILADHQRRILSWEGQVEGLKKALYVEKKENEVLSASILNLTFLLRNATSSDSEAIQDAAPVMAPVAVRSVEETSPSSDPLTLDELVGKYPLMEERLLNEPCQKKEEALKRLVSLGFWKQGLPQDEENNNVSKSNDNNEIVGVKGATESLEEAPAK